VVLILFYDPIQPNSITTIRTAQNFGVIQYSDEPKLVFRQFILPLGDELIPDCNNVVSQKVSITDPLAICFLTKHLNMNKLLAIISLLLLLSSCFPKKAGSRLSHFKIEAPDVGQPAPNFELQTPDGKIVSLESFLGGKPIVMQLGSHSCPVYRYRRFSMSKLYRKYADKAHFLLVYTLEAHPKGAINPYADKEWVSSFNYLTNTIVSEHQSPEERASMASYSTKKLNIAYPVVVDNMNNEIWKAYGRAPSAAFVIDPSGNIALRLPWVDPLEIAKTLNQLLEPNAP